MARLVILVLSLAGAAACAPEVMLARSDEPAGEAGEASGGEAGEAGEATGGEAGEQSGGAGGAGGEAGAAGSGEGGSAVIPPEPSRLLADSVADFSLTQGERGWYYGYDTGFDGSFTLLPRQSIVTAYTPPSGDVWDCWVTEEMHWTQIFQLGAHPNGTDTSPPSVPAQERAVRRWISNFSGDIRISGEIAKIDVTIGGSNGVEASVVIDGDEIYTVFIGGEDGGGLSYDLQAIVDIGSSVDLVLDAHEGSDHHDLSRFTAVIERDETPSGN